MLQCIILMNMILLYQTQDDKKSKFKKSKYSYFGPCEFYSLGFIAVFLHLKMYLHNNLIKPIWEGLVYIVTSLILHIVDRS